MFSVTHDNRPATIYVSEEAVYATYDDTDDSIVFYYTEIDDESVDIETDLTAEFGFDMVPEYLMNLIMDRK